MSKVKKTKKQIIVVPTTTKMINQKTKSTTLLAKPRPVRSKENTLAYYNCLIDKIANPANAKVKITQLTKNCKCSKGEVVKAQAEHKQKLVRELAKNYLSFGQSLGHYLQADIVGCAKELKK